MRYSRLIEGSGWQPFEVHAQTLLARRPTLGEEAVSVAEALGVVCEIMTLSTNEVMQRDADYRSWKAQARNYYRSAPGPDGKRVPLTEVEHLVEALPEFAQHKSLIRQAQTRLTYAETLLKALQAKNVTLQIRRDLITRGVQGAMSSEGVVAPVGLEGETPYDSDTGGVQPWVPVDWRAEADGADRAKEGSR